MEGSLLDTVGADIVAIISPVSICMFLVVLLVKILNPHGSDSASASVAMLVYEEKATDSAGEKFGGALLNALVFVVVVTVATFVLVALFYFRCTKFLRAYMGFSALTVLAYMGGAVGVMLVRKWSIPVDAVTFCLLLFNFSVVGVLAVFFCKMPILLTQGYLVLIGMLVAFWFTMLPEWTTWTMLMAMAAYDIVAVLVPGGPLNMLVELAIARDEDIPALIYESRPITSSRAVAPSSAELSAQSLPPGDPPRQSRRWSRRRTAATRSPTPTPDATMTARERQSLISRLKSAFASAPVREELPAPQSVDLDSEVERASPGGRELQSERRRPDVVGSLDGAATHGTGEIEIDDGSQTGSQVPSSMGSSQSDDESVPLVRRHTQASGSIDAPVPPLRSVPQPQEIGRVREEEEAEGIGLGMSGAIKLGLGDFIFYSVLVGRAAMYDMMTVYACYLAIIAGLGATLILLAVYQRALPALPFSISLGVMFYFLTRLVLEPFVITLARDFVSF